jgi:hypothetical protein
VISAMPRVSRVDSRSRRSGGSKCAEAFGMLKVIQPVFECTTVAANGELRTQERIESIVDRMASKNN